MVFDSRLFAAFVTKNTQKEISRHRQSIVAWSCLWVCNGRVQDSELLAVLGTQRKLLGETLLYHQFQCYWETYGKQTCNWRSGS